MLLPTELNMDKLDKLDGYLVRLTIVGQQYYLCLGQPSYILRSGFGLVVLEFQFPPSNDCSMFVPFIPILFSLSKLLLMSPFCAFVSHDVL